MGSCCPGFSGGIRAFNHLEADKDVVDASIAYETHAPSLIFPLHVAWVKHIGCTAQRRVNGEDITINVKEDHMDHIRVVYGPHFVALEKCEPAVAREEEIQIGEGTEDGVKVLCKVMEYVYSFVQNVVHTWLMWMPLDDMVSPGLPIRMMHKALSSRGGVKREETTSWTQLSLKDHFAENFHCRLYLELSGIGETEKKMCFLSPQAPGWIVQRSSRSELCVEYNANMDLSWDAFLVTHFSEAETYTYLSHLTP